MKAHTQKTSSFVMLFNKFITSNKLTFTVTLPLLLIQDMMNNDFLKKFDLTYVLFCFFVTLLCCIGTTIVTKIVMKDKSIIAEFVQASYRSSAGSRRPPGGR